MTKWVYFFGAGKAEGDSSWRDLLGGKGAGLAEMTTLGLPVPPGLTISTELCNRLVAKAASVGKDADAMAEILEGVSKVEKSMGARLGDPESPLLVSVRSGARASMPGMMVTILNLGMNDAVCEGLAKKTKNRRFALDAHRRFRAMFGDVALGVKKALFEHALEEVRAVVAKQKGIDTTRINSEELKKKLPDSEIPEAELERLVAAFKAIIQKETGKDVPSQPKDQLTAAIDAVFHSWNNPRAIVYRRMHDIPDSWGTACTVQAMVFGNLSGAGGKPGSHASATGVAFTRDPSTGEKKLYGEWLPNAQGEDVVAGIRTPQPLRKAPGTAASLEEQMPETFTELMRMTLEAAACWLD